MPTTDMPATTYPSRSAAEWDETFDLFHASGLTQRQFCEQHGLSRDAFRNRYRVSPKFRGQRRRPPRAASSANDTGPAFRPVARRGAAAAPPPAGAATVVVRVREAIAVECLSGADPVTVAALVRELAR